MLSNRLKAIINMVPKSMIIADIGCDHGKVAAALLKKHTAEHVICSDISAKSLDKARKLVKSSGLCGSVSLLEGNGLAVLEGKEADVAVIAGMGGELIAEILEAGKNKIPNTLVLSCNTMPEILRQWLSGNGYCIEDESLIHEGRHFYPVMLAKKGEPEKLSETELEFGPVLLRKKPKTLKYYVKKRIDNAKGIRAKIEKSDTPKKQELLKEIEDRLKKYSEVEKCL